MGFSSVVKFLAKNSTKIMVGGSIVTGVGGAILAAVGTTKVGPVLDEHKAEMTKIEEAEKLARENGEEYSERDIRRDKMKVFGKTFLGLGKCYGGAAACVVVSVGLNLGAHKLKNRTIAKTASMAAGAFATLTGYRKSVISEDGIERDRHHLMNAVNHKRELSVINSDSKSKKETVTKEVVDEDIIDLNIDLYNGFVYYFSKYNSDGCVNPEWDDNRDILIAQLEARQKWYNTILKSRDLIFLDEIVADCGMNVTQSSRNEGWKWKEGRTVSFGMDKDEVELFRQGKVDGIFLVFNVDGKPDKNGRFRADIISNYLEASND